MLVEEKSYMYCTSAWIWKFVDLRLVDDFIVESNEWLIAEGAGDVYILYIFLYTFYVYFVKTCFQNLNDTSFAQKSIFGQIKSCLLMFWNFKTSSKRCIVQWTRTLSACIYWWWLWLWRSRRLWLICDCDSRAHASSAPIGVGLIVRISIEWNRHVNVYSCESMVHIHIHMYIYNILFSIESLLLGSMYIWSL